MAIKKVTDQVKKTVLEIGEEKVQSITKAATQDFDKVAAKAQKEFDKVKKQAESTLKKAESYIKKNPEKSAAIAAGVGVALATAAALFFSGDSKKKGRKK